MIFLSYLAVTLYVIFTEGLPTCKQCPVNDIWSKSTDYTGCESSCELFESKLQTRKCDSSSQECPCSATTAAKKSAATTTAATPCLAKPTLNLFALQRTDGAVCSIDRIDSLTVTVRGKSKTKQDVPPEHPLLTGITFMGPFSDYNQTVSQNGTIQLRLHFHGDNTLSFTDKPPGWDNFREPIMILPQTVVKYGQPFEYSINFKKNSNYIFVVTAAGMPVYTFNTRPAARLLPMWATVDGFWEYVEVTWSALGNQC